MKESLLQPKTRTWIRLALIALYGVALVRCADPETSSGRRRMEQENPGLKLWCNPATNTIEVLAVSMRATNLDALQSLNGDACTPSPQDTAAPNSQTGGVSNAGGGTPPAPPFLRSNPQTTAAAVHPTLQDDYANLLPLPFTPLFTAATLGAYTPTCTPNVSVYAVNHLANIVNRYATCPLALGKTITVAANPVQAALTPDGSTLIVTCYGNAIAFIDTASDTVTTTLPTPNYNPNGIAITPDGTKAYVTNYNNTPGLIFQVDLKTRQLLPQTLTVNSFPKSIFLTPDGALAWVLFYQSSSIYVIDTLSMTVAATVNAGGQADTGMAFSPDGTRAYVSVYGGSVSVFNTATLAQVASIPVGDQPTDILVTKDGSTAYVNSFAANAAMTVIDTATNTVIGTIPQNGPAMGLSIVH